MVGRLVETVKTSSKKGSNFLVLDNDVDILRAKDILGPNLGSLKGKTTMKQLSRVILDVIDDLPERMLDLQWI